MIFGYKKMSCNNGEFRKRRINRFDAVILLIPLLLIFSEASFSQSGSKNKIIDTVASCCLVYSNFDPTISKDASVSIGTHGGFGYKVLIRGQDSKGLHIIKNLIIRFRYPGGIIGIPPKEFNSLVVLGNDLKTLGGRIIDIKKIELFDKNEEINIKISLKKGMIFKYDLLELLNITCYTFMPWYTDSSGNIQFDRDWKKPFKISHTIVDGDGKLIFTGDSATIKLREEPPHPRRDSGLKMKLNPYSFKISDTVKLKGDKVLIEFEIGSYEAFTEIKIYDSDKKEIKTLLSESMQDGSYQIYLETNDLAPGTYYAQMKSGNFTSPFEKFNISG